jgi:hypothetical protein
MRIPFNCQQLLRTASQFAFKSTQVRPVHKTSHSLRRALTTEPPKGSSSMKYCKGFIIGAVLGIEIYNATQDISAQRQVLSSLSDSIEDMEKEHSDDVLIGCHGSRHPDKRNPASVSQLERSSLHFVPVDQGNLKLPVAYAQSSLIKDFPRYLVNIVPNIVGLQGPFQRSGNIFPIKIPKHVMRSLKETSRKVSYIDVSIPGGHAKGTINEYTYNGIQIIKVSAAGIPVILPDGQDIVAYGTPIEIPPAKSISFKLIYFVMQAIPEDYIGTKTYMGFGCSGIVRYSPLLFGNYRDLN